MKENLLVTQRQPGVDIAMVLILKQIGVNSLTHHRVYLLQEMGIDLGYKFVWHNKPYSSDLQDYITDNNMDDVVFLDKLNLLGYELSDKVNKAVGEINALKGKIHVDILASAIFMLNNPTMFSGNVVSDLMDVNPLWSKTLCEEAVKVAKKNYQQMKEHSQMKKTEKIAKAILEKRGKVFDGTYFDDGSSESMPDLRYANGRFVEITQTNHNNGLFCDDEDTEKAYKKEMKRQEVLDKLDLGAYRRYMTNDYPDGCGHSRSSDEKILREAYGWNKDTQTFGSEFGSLLSTIEYSIQNISKVIKRKHEKHKRKNIELFVFVTEEEFDLFEKVIENSQWNPIDKKLLEEIYDTCFKKIYLSVYNLEKQDYTYNEDKFIEINCEVKKIKRTTLMPYA